MARQEDKMAGRHSVDAVDAVEAFDEAEKEEVVLHQEGDGRHRATVVHHRWFLYEIQVRTYHDVNGREAVSKADALPVRPGLPWARWKARRMVARAHRRDVRQKQPWAV
jgi:hypothetical protein